jgi:hypothetical protein
VLFPLEGQPDMPRNRSGGGRVSILIVNRPAFAEGDREAPGEEGTSELGRMY